GTTSACDLYTSEIIGAMTFHIPRPKKSLGQNFLVDPNYIRKIISAAEIMPNETVLEIGPGHGVLTRALAEKAGRVIAIELDHSLFEILEGKLSDLQNLKLIRADAMTFDYQQLDGPLKVVANLPYNIAIPLIFRLMEIRKKLTYMVLMLQKEVGQRIVAKPGGKDYGVLSVTLQYYTEPRLMFTVPRTCFVPRPRVDSAIIKLKVLSDPRWPVRDEGWFLRVLRAGFSHRRKFLSNALMDAGFSSQIVRYAFHHANMDPKRRAETLSPLEFCTLADQLYVGAQPR
ncbi:MAG: 16S rRNA (adenine(1518)-N(6)/adenine(1519)-N(6))-dimethyltransferase RsmA, partial [Nitrospira sp.]|nr:16S rRNA (adenine(1518)-N(6)/adenine(1519)-N(6))-dimethyltransferase RsmA [Nitrospira sp.]